MQTAAAVVTGEPLDQHGGEFVLAIHEHALQGDEGVVEDDHRFLTGVARIPRVDIAAVQAARVAGLAAVDVGYPGRVHRQRADHRIVLVARSEADRRHDDEPVRVQASGLVCLGTGDVNPVLGATRDVQVHVGIGLRAWRLAAVALDVGHGASDHHVAALRHGDERLEALVIGGAALRVDLEGDRMQRVERVHSDAALEAGARELAKSALHLVLHDQVFGALGDVQEAVHPSPGVGRVRRGERRIAHREVVGLRDRVDRWTDHRMVHRLGDALAKQVNLEIAAAQALDVFGAGADRYGFGRGGRGPCGGFCHGIPLCRCAAVLDAYWRHAAAVRYICAFIVASRRNRFSRRNCRSPSIGKKRRKKRGFLAEIRVKASRRSSYVQGAGTILMSVKPRGANQFFGCTDTAICATETALAGVTAVGR